MIPGRTLSPSPNVEHFCALAIIFGWVSVHKSAGDVAVVLVGLSPTSMNLVKEAPS